MQSRLTQVLHTVLRIDPHTLGLLALVPHEVLDPQGHPYLAHLDLPMNKSKQSSIIQSWQKQKYQL